MTKRRKKNDEKKNDGKKDEDKKGWKKGQIDRRKNMEKKKTKEKYILYY